MLYDGIYQFKSFTTEYLRFVRVTISETEIRPIEKCECGNCQNDSDVCGYFYGLAQYLEEDSGFVVKCSRRSEDGCS